MARSPKIDELRSEALKVVIAELEGLADDEYQGSQVQRFLYDLEKGDLAYLKEEGVLETLECEIREALEKRLRQVVSEFFPSPPKKRFSRATPPKWVALSENRDRFNEELDSHLAAIRAIMLAMYFPNTGPGRPKKNAERDAQIVALRDRDKLTFGQIGPKFGISGNAADRAYHRAKEAADPDLLRLEAIRQAISIAFK